MKTRNLHMRLLSLVLCVCMVLSLMPAVAPVIEAEAANNVTPNYITDIGIAYAMNQSKAKSLVTNNGFTLMDKDLNEDAGGRYIYMGYKTSTDPSRAITGIIFREGENPPDSLNYGGATFYLVGGSYEGNGTGDGAVDLNVGAGGAYIYTYITRDTNYDYPILWMGFYSDFPSNGIYVGGVNTSGSAENLNADAGGISIYLNYITFEHIGYIAAYSSAESMAYMRHYYLDANGITVSKISTKQLKNHLDTYTYTPSVPANITLNGYSLAFKGWSTSNGNNPSTQTTSVSYWDNTDSSNYKCFYAVYATDFKVTYDANGGTGAPAAESYTVNGKPTGSGESGSTSFVYTRISSVVPTNTNGCKYFLGWSTNKNATSAEYQPNQLYDNQGGYIQFKTNTTLYAVWQDHYDINKDGECDSCQMTMTAPPTVNGAYQISNKNQLIWFMQHVNAGNKSASAVLTADIDMGGYVWTPIASTASYHESGAAVTDSGYTGTFDGAGHVIKNFTVTGGAGDGSSGASGNVKSYGLFGTVSGTVKNLGIDSYTFNVGTADCRAGAIVGQLVTGGRIENCYVINSKVLTGSRIAGAIAGCNYGGTIDSCFAYNCEVTGHARCAAIVGDTKDDGGSKIGTVTNCYADKNPVGSQNGGSSYVMNCATLTASQFTSGEAAWKLNGNSSDGIWKQTVGSGLPGFTGGTVYQVKRCDNKTVTYSNSSVNPQAHTYSNANGLCTFCGAGNPDAVASVSRNGTVTGVYTTLNDAIQAVKDFTDDDNAVVTILKDIALGNSYQTIGSGVFTIDLNGCEISSDVGHRGVLYAGIYSANLTVIDSRGGGKITGARCGIEVLNGATVTIAGGTISGGNFSGDCGVSADGSTVEISGGSINGYYGVCATDNSIVTISGGTISSQNYGVYGSYSSVTISGGTISSQSYGVDIYNGTVTISGGTISGYHYGVDTENGTLTISGGTISSEYYAVTASDSTLTITGGTIISQYYGVDSYCSTVTISGGTISGEWYDIYADATLTVGEDGVGATFPGGITVLDTTLNEILGEGLAYWQNGKQLSVTGNAFEIQGGDVVIKAACKHLGDKTYTNNGDDHSFNCADCCNTIPEAHSYTNYVCVCGAVSPDAVASVTIGGEVSYYATLNDAIAVAQNCSAADQAVVTILKDIDLGDDYQRINGGVFTFDLNGFELSSLEDYWGVFVLRNGADITIIDSRGDGKITGVFYGIEAHDSTVTISGGTISGQDCGVYVTGCTVTISGGTISGQTYGVYAYNNSDVTISGGTIIGKGYDLRAYKSSVFKLTVGENSVGATFPGGIKVYGTTLNAILGEGMAYWQGNQMIIPADGATQITGGDVVIKAECKHPGDKTYTNNGDDHSFNCADCCNTIPEAHSYTNYVCVCGAVSPDAVASVTIGGEVSYYATLDDAIQAVTNCTAADQAVVTILKDIALGNGYQEINGGTFTFDLNGFEVSSSNSSWGVLVLRFGADVTVTDSGESGKITGACYGIEAYYSTVTISGGTITGGQSDGVRADNSTVEISGGTISGEYGGVRADNSTVEISGGTISGQYLGVHAYNSTVTISGGTISGENGGVYGYESTVIISGGTISGENCGVSVYNSTVTIIGGTITGVQSDGVFGDESTVTISGGAIIDGYCGVSVNNDCTLIVSGGTITGVQSEGVYGSESTVTIIGGTISGEGYDIYSDDCTITLSVGENGVGATFLDGMEVGGTTLNAILGEGAAYWQGNKMIVPADGATSITGGDVVIKAPCTHSGDLIDSEYYSNEFHQKTCGCGFINELEEHRFGADSVCEDCGYDKNTITITMTDDWGDSWNGNGIHVYKDGVLIGTVTIESGYTGTWSCPYDPDAEYEFYWQRGKYPEECSFEISIAGETVKKVSGKVCSRYIDGQLLYPLPLYSGWIEMDGKWYYYDPETNEPVTGIVRVPYPTEPINGITYGPNPEDVAYCESKGQTFVNKDTAWFWFNYDGSFKYNETGTWHVGIGNKSDNVFVVNGMIPWHVGMVATLGRHYYFIGDETNGANKYAVGDVYITRNTTDRDFVIGGVYTFDEYGALCEYDGITEVNGVLRYYEDARLMAGNGLTKVGDNYIYVRSNGELAVDCKYYVPGNDLGIASGLYTFDENGFMVEPVSTDKNGVYFENGAWYYYENGKIGYNKGLINVSTNWHFEDGSVMGYTAFIYVRSNGKLATGDYYITNVSNGYGLFSAGQKVNFSEDGMAAAPKNGIHEIDGSLYYFVNNRIQYNAGLMEYNGGWIYVRSNGVLATGKYWITNTNGNLDAGMYEFGADGYMVITDTKDGIVNDNGVLHYYLDGKKRYGLGLIQLPEGTYIYVRTNGELAVGSYWITNHNGLLPAGMYEFSEDGILINN